MPNTKINKDEQFTPWEDEYINLMQLTKSPKQTQPKRDTFRATNYSRETDRASSRIRKKSFERACLSVSKINFYKAESQGKLNQSATKIPWRRYEGPRINFYLKMNPKHLKIQIPGKTSLHKTIERESLVSTNTSNAAAFPTHRTLDQSTTPPGKPANGIRKEVSFTHLKFAANPSNCANIKKMKEEYKNMKKLKLIYQSRLDNKGRI